WSSIHPSERFMIGRGDCVEEDMSPVPNRCVRGLHRHRLCSRPASSDLGCPFYHADRVKATCHPAHRGCGASIKSGGLCPKRVSGTVRIVVLPAAYESIEFQTTFLGKASRGSGRRVTGSAPLEFPGDGWQPVRLWSRGKAGILALAVPGG